jgi:hypothetical protein
VLDGVAADADRFVSGKGPRPKGGTAALLARAGATLRRLGERASKSGAAPIETRSRVGLDARATAMLITALAHMTGEQVLVLELARLAGGDPVPFPQALGAGRGSA